MAPASLPADDAIRAQLQKLLLSDQFRNSERQKRFLTFTVEQSLSGKRDTIKEALIGIEVFDRKPGYDSQADSIVRVEARRVRAKLEVYYANGGRQDSVVIHYPRGTYAPEFRGQIPDSGVAQPAVPQTLHEPVQPTSRRRWIVPLFIAAVAALAVGLVSRSNFPPPLLRIGKVGIVAHRSNSRCAADRHRLFFVQRTGSRFTLAQVRLDGEGPAVPIATPIQEPAILDISPDLTELLLGGGESEDSQSLWVISTARGPARRLNGLSATDASWSSDGKRLVFVRGQEVFVAASDGSSPRSIAHIPGDRLERPRWSPDLAKIRLTSIDRQHEAESLWEVAANGANPHPLLPNWHAQSAGAGVWVAGGKYFVFGARINGSSNLWALLEDGGFFGWPREPFPLTAGPVGITAPVASPDGRRIYAIDRSARGELVKYVPAGGAVSPYLGGISGYWCSFSPDGQYVAYTSFPDKALWRSRTDGSEALQLTRPPYATMLPRWSPDGSRILFMAAMPGVPGQLSKLYVVPAAGGNPEAIIPEPGTQAEAAFSPDGKSIVFGRLITDNSEPVSSKAIYFYDMDARKLSEIPGSRGFFKPAWSPDGRYIAALDRGHEDALMLWDSQTRKWRQIAPPGQKENPSWSKDSRCLYYQFIAGGEDAIFRVRVPDGMPERIVDTSRFDLADVSHSVFAGLTPDNSILLIRVRSAYDISALDLEFR